MQRGWWLFGALAGIALVIGASAIAYRAVTHDRDDGARLIQVTAPPGTDAGGSQEVIRVVDDRDWRDHGFFPGFFLFPLLFLSFIVLLFWGLGGRWRGRGDGWYDGRARFEEWHRQQHEGQPPAADRGAGV